jgi:ATP-dependent protease HslVU (ClpYQ) peptidase subunit
MENQIIKQYESLTPLLEGCSKTELTRIAKEQADEIIEAGTSEQAFAILTKFEHFVKEKKDNLKEDAYIEIGKGNDFAFGVKLIKSKSAKYYYDNCNDPKLNELLERQAATLKEIKDRQTFLKGIKGSEDIVTSDGEIVKLFPPLKKITDVIKTQF